VAATDARAGNLARAADVWSSNVGGGEGGLACWALFSSLVALIVRVEAAAMRSEKRDMCGGLGGEVSLGEVWCWWAALVG
jgi:hypothetical protein